ncbi:MAG: cysteine--tRNA ligase [Firmicutes bacterium]|nr:cysteine--tRNA ligase [Bacillota bacterium]
MPIQIYNTLTRKKESFVPRDPGSVSIYVCGITPYDQSHLGHAVPSVIWDAIRRFLEYEGYTVRLVQNFTDIDDKVIDRAQATGEKALDISNRYVEEYLRDMDALGVKRADVYPRVSQEIPAIIELVEGLVEKDHAYVADGDVYFDVSSFPQYGQLSGQVLDELAAGTRFAVDERKRNPMDFALWKSAKPGEPAWESPWGKGRPGWHIECSAMSLKYLGNHLDLHGGGADLIFPHHENEIAQSDAYTGEPPFVGCWVHNGLLQVKDEKMSKSLGNFTPLQELLNQHPAEAIRFYLLSSHYRSPLQYSEEKIAEARRGWERLMTAVNNLESLVAEVEKLDEAPCMEHVPAIDDLAKAVNGTRDKFLGAMRDDFNTAAAIGALFELARDVHSFAGGLAHMDSGKQRKSLPVLREAYQVFLELGGGILGIVDTKTTIAHGDELVGDLIELLIDVRKRARDARDWATADFIRDELENLGIRLEDSPLGTRWKL